MDKLKKYSNKTFEEIKHIDEQGNEYWEAREFMLVLGYSKWGNFSKVIDKAKIACNISNNNVFEHFADAGKVLEVGNKAKMKVADYHLSRYACYLIVQNADPRKKAVAMGQTYFAVQTRRMEITQDETAQEVESFIDDAIRDMPVFTEVWKEPKQIKSE